ncbi:MAG: carbon-nitrogen hydrolase family protein [Intestinibacter sp.]|uniref:carbon-nitrogen hydrolase family protein n=1 Tax=Intestinibacter sp. TaxID=1965304 RepID=UPI0025C24B94|nr:carbon-nitrogen hydrolase family protein [Intestinibacter sp.]MCI6738160.1 carbon-nitrogen hydrolase family protein [Intestinibacter sp.]
MNKIKIALIQMHVEEDKHKNLENASEFVKKTAEDGCDIAVLPEMFTTPYKTDNFPIYAELEGDTSFKLLSNMARENNIYLVGGSIPEKDDENLVYNTSYVFDRKGQKIGKHRKVYLFDIDVENGQSFKESDTLTAGDKVTVFDTEFGKIGLCICFDFRFPEIARLMAQNGAKAIIVPAAFNMTTGPAHWDLMFRSRAVDNQVYAIGCAPSRDVDGCYVSYGNSIVVSPWGDILYKMDEKEGYKIIEIDLDYVDKIRKELPLMSARRLDLYELIEK